MVIIFDTKAKNLIQTNVFNVHLIKGYIFIDDILNEQKSHRLWST